MVYLAETYGGMAYVYIKAAAYLKVAIDDLIERTERGEMNWVQWSLAAIEAEQDAAATKAKQAEQQAEFERALRAMDG